MSNDPVDGGTVTYHYKEYRAGSDHPWCIWFTADAALDDDAAVRFTAAEGRAMGLTPPAPAPLVVTCNGHSIELSDEEADVVVDLWADYADVRDPNAELRCKTKLAGLLRDARQDPQPASDPASCPWCSHGTPCSYGDDHPERFVPQPAPADSDTLDFDAMPIGTVLWDSYSDFLLRFPGGWSYNPPADEDDYYDIDAYDGPFTVVYQPAPVSPYEGLRAVLAGRTDADELIEYASKHWNYVDESDAVTSVLGAVGDAARSGGAT